jgi:hypothetical protein
MRRQGTRPHGDARAGRLVEGPGAERITVFDHEIPVDPVPLVFEHDEPSR